MIDEALIGRLRELHENATPGPWRADTWACYVLDDGGPLFDIRGASRFSETQMLMNGELVAAMRNALPALLTALDEQGREIERLREERDGYMYESHNRPGDGLCYSESDACHCEICERVRKQLAERTPAEWKQALAEKGSADV